MNARPVLLQALVALVRPGLAAAAWADAAGAKSGAALPGILLHAPDATRRSESKVLLFSPESRVPTPKSGR